MYSRQVIEHYEHPRNVGVIPQPDGVGIVGSPASGEMMKLTIRVLQNTIVDAKFKAFGCPTAIAASSVVTELIKGLPIIEALKISSQQIHEALGGLPQDKLRFASAAEELIKATIHNYTSQLEGGDRNDYSD
jgi:nitrogen fixation NifU-like protein